MGISQPDINSALVAAMLVLIPMLVALAQAWVKKTIARLDERMKCVDARVTNVEVKHEEATKKPTATRAKRRKRVANRGQSRSGFDGG